jgi:RNA polymerase sigma-70 factor (ECF subfamily)
MNYKDNLSDEQLIQFFLAGDTRAMATLVELYKDRVYTSIYGIVQDKNQAEDIFQAVFIRIIDQMIAGKTIGEGKFLSWAMQVAHGICIQRTRMPLKPSAYANQPEVIKISENSLAGTLFTANTFESNNKIRLMIDSLPEEQREVIVLNHYSGLHLNEIAELMKCSLTHVLETLRFGLRNLGKIMEEKEVFC